MQPGNRKAILGNQALLLLGGARAQRAATAKHPFGHGGVAAKVELEPTLDFRGVALALNEAESHVRAAVDRVGVMYLEPDVHDPTRADSPE